MRTLLLMTAVVSLGSGQTPNALSPEESKQGWVLLFDGKTMNGWEPHGTSDWKAADGALVCGGTSPSWLGTANTYSDYVLKLEFQGPEKVNSGVFLRSSKEGQPHITGYELQIWDYQPAGYNTGGLVGTAKASPVKIKGDQWNQYEVTARGDQIVIVLNGAKVLDVRDAKSRGGVIGFQCQRDHRIEFRNIKLQPLKD